MWSVKMRPKPGSASFAARSFSEVGFGDGWISKLDQAVWSILAAETPMDLSPGLALAPYGRTGWFYVNSAPPAKPVASPGRVAGQALAEAGSPVCFSKRTFRPGRRRRF